MVGPDLSGTVFDGRYRLATLLGAGGMGQVYEGMHLALDRRVAIKVLPSQLSEDPRFRARFAREARAAAKISHRNVVQIMDFGESPDGPVYFVMEFLEGRDLGALLRESGRLPWVRARHLLLQATSAIKASHAHGIIHRDIKPGNCFVLDLPLEGVTDVVKLLDFGIAKVLTEAEQEGVTLLKPLTATGEIMGTASYMSPEQARCEPMDARSDVYSLGIMAYEMLTGRVPFVGGNIAQVVAKLLFDCPEPLHRSVPEIHPEVEALVLRAIAKDPAERFHSMAEFEAALGAVQEVSIDSVPTRVLSAVGSGGRVATGRKLTATGTSGNPTVVLREPETKAEPRGAEDSFEDAETPDPIVLMPRFGEPFPLRPRGSEDAEEPSGGANVEPVGDEPIEVDEVTSARIRLVPDPGIGSTDVAASIQDIAVEVVPATSASIDVASSEPAVVVVDVPEPSMDRVDAWAMPQIDPEPAAEARSTEGVVPRRARSKAWAVVLGLVLMLGASAAITKLVMSRPDVEALAGAAASGEAVESIEPVEQRPTTPAQTDAPAVDPEAGAPAKPAELDVARKEEAVHTPAPGEPVLQVAAPTPIEPMKPAADVDEPDTPDVSAKIDGPSVAPVPKKKHHESVACGSLRDRTYRAHEAGEYLQVVKLAASGPCWPKSLKLERLRMHQNALLETRQFTQCVDAGRGVSDAAVMKMTSNCQKRLRQTETTSKSQ